MRSYHKHTIPNTVKHLKTSFSKNILLAPLVAILLFAPGFSAKSQTNNSSSTGQSRAPAVPLPWDGIDYEFDEFRQTKSCVGDDTEQYDVVLERKKDHRVTLTIGRKSLVLNQAPTQDIMGPCYRGVTCRSLNRKSSVVAVQDLSCGRGGGGAKLQFRAVDLLTLKVTNVSSAQADKLGWFLDIIDRDTPEYKKFFPNKSYKNIMSISIMDSSGGAPDGAIYMSIPDQKNSFFSGAEHELFISNDGNLSKVTGQFFGKNQIGEFKIQGPGNGKWSIKTTKVTTAIAEPKHIQGEGTLQIFNSSFKIMFVDTTLLNLF